MPFQLNNKFHLLRKKVAITPQQKEQISQTLKRKYASGEIKSNFYKGMPLEKHPNFGKNLSLETKNKISSALKAKNKSLNHKKKLSEVKKKLFAEGKIKTNLPNYSGTHISEEKRLKLSLALMGKNKGEKNGQWRGGSWHFRQGLNATQYKHFRLAVLKRDGKCLDCFSEKNLHVHHIIPVSEDRSKALDQDNAMVLCKRCHIMTHSIKARSNPIYVAEFLLEALDRIQAREKNAQQIRT